MLLSISKQARKKWDRRYDSSSIFSRKVMRSDCQSISAKLNINSRDFDSPLDRLVKKRSRLAIGEERRESLISITPPVWWSNRYFYEIFYESRIDECDRRITRFFNRKYLSIIIIIIFKIRLSKWNYSCASYFSEESFHLFVLRIYRNPIIISDKMIDGRDRIECRAIQFEWVANSIRIGEGVCPFVHLDSEM